MRLKMAKPKLTVTVTQEILEWIDGQIAKSHFADRSHSVEYSLRKVRELIKKGEIKF